MSRFGYLEDGEPDYPNAGDLWDATVRNTLRGRKALPFLRELEAALLALPEPKLIEGALARTDGACCALGAWGKARLDAGGTLHHVWSEGPEIRTFAQLATLGEATADESLWTEEFGVLNGMLRPLAWMIAYQNDEGGAATDEERYAHVLRWVRQAIAENPHGREEVTP